MPDAAETPLVKPKELLCQVWPCASGTLLTVSPNSQTERPLQKPAPTPVAADDELRLRDDAHAFCLHDTRRRRLTAGEGAEAKHDARASQCQSP
jgi:hypothetical protein